jgi:hypothetical protein
MRIHDIISEAIGPHNNKELELMIDGTKPAALAYQSEISKWWPYIQKYGWTVEELHLPPDITQVEYIISQKPETAQQIKELLTSVRAGKFPTGISKSVYYAKLGNLLGYSATDIAHFILRAQVVGYKTWDKTAEILSRILGPAMRSPALRRAAAVGAVAVPIAKAATGVGANLMAYSGDLNTGEDEELDRIRQKYPTFASTQEPK